MPTLISPAPAHTVLDRRTIAITPERFDAAARLYAAQACEAVSVEYAMGCWYIYGSELAALRVYARNAQHHHGRITTGYSRHVRYHYTAIEGQWIGEIPMMLVNHKPSSCPRP